MSRKTASRPNQAAAYCLARSSSAKLLLCAHYHCLALLLLVFGASCNQNTQKPLVDQPAGADTRAEKTAPVPSGFVVAEGSGAQEGSSTHNLLSREPQLATIDGQVTSITTSKGAERNADASHDIDPHNDGWDSEVFAAKAGKQIKRIGSLLESDTALEVQDFSDLVSDDFACSLLRPKPLQQVFADQSFTVLRGSDPDPPTAYSGKEGLAQALGELRKDLEGTTQRHSKIKVIRVTPAEFETANEIPTTILLESGGKKADGAVQLTATWHCRWRVIPDQPLKLTWIGMIDHEVVFSHNPNETLFSDCTESIFESVPAFDQQLRHGIAYWQDHLEAYLGVYFDGHHGLALGDVNGDGLDDLYICEPGGLPNRLFLQNKDGSLRDVSAESRVDFLDHSRSALLVDLDNDGDQDMVLSMENRLKVFSNDGHGTFQQSASLDVNNQKAYSLSAADIDQDGDLDIYACFYHGVEHAANRLPDPIPYHDAKNGGPNRLFRNEGQGNLVDATDEVGLSDNNYRWSFASAWEDVDNDGDQDLYVANDFGRNNLYRNDGGKFKDVAGPTGAEDQNFGMSVSFGDYNRDGWMDLYVSNMFSSAGGRISFQPQFQTGSSDDLKAKYQRLARGNSLLENARTGLAGTKPAFLDVSEQAGVTMGRWAWGSLFADINNDGWDDLVVANGYITGKKPDDL